MDNDIFIRIKTLIDPPSDVEKERVRQEIETRIEPIKLKTTVEGAKDVEKIVAYYDVLGNKKQKLRTVETTISNELGKQQVYTFKTAEDSEKLRLSRIKDLDNVKLTTEQIHQQAIEKRRLLDQMEKFRSLNTKLLESDERSLRKLETLEKILQKLDPSSKNFEKDLREIKLGFQQVGNEVDITKHKLNEASRYTYIFGQNILEAGKKFATWLFIGNVIMFVVRQFREAIRTLKEIDTELINIAKVTEYTNREMLELTKTAIRVGREFGRTAQEYLQSVTEFARAGFGRQAEEYAELSLLLQNVGDVTATVANETLIAANAGFQLGGSYQALLGVIDKFNNVANKNATTVEKLSDAMKIGASVFHAAGLSIDETVALIGTATATTQRAGTEIARAWRTILMNIRQVQDEEADVTKESMAKAEKALDSIGIIVRDTPDTFRPMFNILQDLGKEWKNLTQVEQSYIAESLAGKRQANVLISTLQNWDMVEKQLIESINSRGSALRENEIYMQSWEARAKQLSASLTSFWANLIDTGAIKTAISALDLLVQALDFLINNQFSRFIIRVTAMSAVIYGLGKALNALRNTQLITAITTNIFNMSLVKLNTTIKALTTTMFSSPLFYVAVAVGAIYYLVQAIDSFNEKLEKQIELVRELDREIEALDAEYQQLKNLENRTEAQEKYLELLERELKIKKELQKVDARELLDQLTGEMYAGVVPETHPRISGRGAPAQSVYVSRAQLREQELMHLQDLFEQLLETDSHEEFLKIEKQIYNTSQSLLEFQKLIYELADSLGNEMPPEVLALADSIGETTKNILEQIDQMHNAQDAVDDLVDATKKVARSFEEMIRDFNTAASSFEAFDKIRQELDDYGRLSLRTMTNIIEEHADLIVPMLQGEAALREALNQKIIELENQALEAHREALKVKLQTDKTFFIATIRNNAELWSLVTKAYGDDADAFETIGNLKIAINDKVIEIVGKRWAEFYKQSGENISALINALGDFSETLTGGGRERIYDQIRALRPFEDLAKRIEDTVDKVTNNVDGGLRELEKLGSASASTFDLMQTKLEAINREIMLINEQLEVTTSFEDKQILYDRMIKAYQEKQKVLQSIREVLHSELLQVETKLKSQLSATDFNKIKNGAYEFYSTTDKGLSDLIKRFQDLNSQIQSTEDQMRDVVSSIKSIIVDLLQQQKNAQIEILESVRDSIINNFKDQLNIGQYFDIDEFLDKIAKIEGSLESLDFESKFKINLGDIVTIGEIDSDLSNIANKILGYNEKINKLSQANVKNRDSLNRTIKDEIALIKDLEKLHKEINDEIRDREFIFRQQQESLQKQIEEETRQYEEQLNIQKEKLRLLDEQYNKEDRLIKLRNIEEEIAKAKADKRFTFITEEGKEILTYNKARVAELEAERNAMLKQFEREDLKAAIQNEIERLEKAKNDRIDILKTELEEMKIEHQKQLDALQLYADSVALLQSILKENTNQHINDLQELYNQQLENLEKTWDQMIAKAEEGTLTYEELMNNFYTDSLFSANEFYDASIKSMQSYVDAMAREYERLKQIQRGMEALKSSSGTTSTVEIQEKEIGTTTITTAPTTSTVTTLSNTPTVSTTTATTTDWKKILTIKERLLHGFHEGGIVGKDVDDFSQFVNDLFKKEIKPDEIVAKLKLGEIVIEPVSGMKNFIHNMKNFASQLISKQPQQVNNQKYYELRDVTIKANNPMELFRGIELAVAARTV